MAKQPETLFKEKVQRHIKDLPNTWFEKIQQVSIRGTPDMLGCVNGHFVALELKTNTGKQSKLQTYTLSKIIKAGGYAIELNPDNFERVMALLERLSAKNSDCI
jgi:hypothetical protein